MAKAKKEAHESLASLGGLILILAVIGSVLYFGYGAWSKNQPTETKTTTSQQVAGQQQQQVAASGPRNEVFTLYPGQGKVLITNYGKVKWKTTAPGLVRERDQAWHGKWKEDLPGRGTSFEWREAHAIEFWVPRDFPGPVTIKIEITPART